MVLRKIDHNQASDFLLGLVDLKKHVFINARKQIGQKVEGISASQF